MSHFFILHNTHKPTATVSPTHSFPPVCSSYPQIAQLEESDLSHSVVFGDTLYYITDFLSPRERLCFSNLNTCFYARQINILSGVSKVALPDSTVGDMLPGPYRQPVDWRDLLAPCQKGVSDCQTQHTTQLCQHTCLKC